jgi:hypothetical protein
MYLTNQISSAYSFAVILYLHFMLHVMQFPMLIVLYFYVSTTRSMCTVLKMSVFSSLMSCFPVMMLKSCEDR